MRTITFFYSSSIPEISAESRRSSLKEKQKHQVPKVMKEPGAKSFIWGLGWSGGCFGPPRFYHQTEKLNFMATAAAEVSHPHSFSLQPHPTPGIINDVRSGL